MNTYRNYEIAMLAILPKNRIKLRNKKKKNKKKNQDERFSASGFKYRKK